MNLSKERLLESVKAFLPQDQEIEQIIKICDLVPYNSWISWKDSVNHSLNIKKDKTVLSYKTIKVGNCVDSNNVEIRDLYHKSSPWLLSKNSKYSFISFAESVTTASNICFIFFLGNDNKLRMSSFIKTPKGYEWTENLSPLTAGITTLRMVVKNINVSNYAVVNSSNVKLPYNCNVVKSWAAVWPPSNALILDMMLTNQLLTRKILTELKILKEQINVSTVV